MSQDTYDVGRAELAKGLLADVLAARVALMEIDDRTVGSVRRTMARERLAAALARLEAGLIEVCEE